MTEMPELDTMSSINPKIMEKKTCHRTVALELYPYQSLLVLYLIEKIV
jgi:hypothetical protein